MSAKPKNSSTVQGWTIADIVRQFNFDRKTVGKILANTKPIHESKNQKVYTGRSFLDAWLSFNQTDRKNVEAERARLLFHQANIAELDEGEKRKDLIHRDKIGHVIDNVAAAVRRVIMNSDLTDKEKKSVMAELKELAKQDFNG